MTKRLYLSLPTKPIPLFDNFPVFTDLLNNTEEKFISGLSNYSYSEEEIFPLFGTKKYSNPLLKRNELFKKQKVKNKRPFLEVICYFCENVILLFENSGKKQCENCFSKIFLIEFQFAILKIISILKDKKIYKVMDIKNNNIIFGLEERIEKQNTKQEEFSVKKWNNGLNILSFIEINIPLFPILPSILSFSDSVKNLQNKFNLFQFSENIFPLKKFKLKSDRQLVFSFLSLLNGLHLLHQNNIIHRNIRPENIFFTENNGKFIFFFIDFSYSYQFISNTNKKNILFHELDDFTAPEINSKKENFKSDIFSLGKIFKKMINNCSTTTIFYNETIWKGKFKNYLQSDEVSEEIKFIESMVFVDMNKRPSLLHTFLFFYNYSKKNQFNFSMNDFPSFVAQEKKKISRGIEEDTEMNASLPTGFYVNDGLLSFSYSEKEEKIKQDLNKFLMQENLSKKIDNPKEKEEKQVIFEYEDVKLLRKQISNDILKRELNPFLFDLPFKNNKNEIEEEIGEQIEERVQEDEETFFGIPVEDTNESFLNNVNERINFKQKKKENINFDLNEKGKEEKFIDF